MRVGVFLSLLIYGKNPCKEILSTDKPIIRAYLEKGINDDLLKILQKKEVETIVLPKNDFYGKFTGNHQGIVFEVPDYKFLSLEEVLKNIRLQINQFFLC